MVEWHGANNGDFKSSHRSNADWRPSNLFDGQRRLSRRRFRFTCFAVLRLSESFIFDEFLSKFVENFSNDFIFFSLSSSTTVFDLLTRRTNSANIGLFSNRDPDRFFDKICCSFFVINDKIFLSLASDMAFKIFHDFRLFSLSAILFVKRFSVSVFWWYIWSFLLLHAFQEPEIK